MSREEALPAALLLILEPPLMLLRPLLIPLAIGPPFAPAPFMSWLFMLEPVEPRVVLELPLVLGLE